MVYFLQYLFHGLTGLLTDPVNPLACIFTTTPFNNKHLTHIQLSNRLTGLLTDPVNPLARIFTPTLLNNKHLRHISLSNRLTGSVSDPVSQNLDLHKKN